MKTEGTLKFPMYILPSSQKGVWHRLWEFESNSIHHRFLGTAMWITACQCHKFEWLEGLLWSCTRQTIKLAGLKALTNALTFVLLQTQKVEDLPSCLLNCSFSSHWDKSIYSHILYTKYLIYRCWPFYSKPNTLAASFAYRVNIIYIVI